MKKKFQMRALTYSKQTKKINKMLSETKGLMSGLLAWSYSFYKSYTVCRYFVDEQV